MATKFNIEKFDGRNDSNLWRVRMKALLVQQRLSQGTEGKGSIVRIVERRGDHGKGAQCNSIVLKQ
jgi:hypothetical protein